MNFETILDDHSFDQRAEEILRCSPDDVERALLAEKPSLKNFMALLSPAAEPLLERMASKAHRITRHRFGRVIQMYAPLYLGNECANACTYCGFSRLNEVKRRTLTHEEAVEEALILNRMGFRHLLLVSGESPKHVNRKTIAALARTLQDRFASLSIEVQPMSTADYSALISAGLDGLVSYQETYHRERYGDYHPRGPKRDFSFRLATAERGGEAGFRRVGLGALLGLEDWRAEGFLVGLHVAYLQKRYWRTQFTVSFPRLRPCAGSFDPPRYVNDRALTQLICALRLFHPDCGLVLSTRENSELREHLLPLGITQMSAGSRTAPGGYSHDGAAEGQFQVDDDRSPDEVASAVIRKGYEPVWKDWDSTFLEKEDES